MNNPISAQIALEKLMEEYPWITDAGHSVYHARGASPQDKALKFQQQRAILLAKAEQVRSVSEWLNSNVAKIKTINTNFTSYGFKHVIAEYVGYMTNGVFIAAAIMAGFKHRTRSGSLSVYFSMSMDSYKRLSKMGRWSNK